MTELVDSVVSSVARKKEIRDMLDYQNQEDVDKILSFIRIQVQNAYIAGTLQLNLDIVSIGSSKQLFDTAAGERQPHPGAGARRAGAHQRFADDGELRLSRQRARYGWAGPPMVCRVCGGAGQLPRFIGERAPKANA